MSKNGKQDNSWWQPGLALFIRLSGWIAGPIIVAVFFGQWLDRKFNTEPWLFLATVGLAFFVSSLGIVKDAMQGMKDIEEREKAEKNKKQETKGSE